MISFKEQDKQHAKQEAIEEEYLAARRAASEAVSISRATLETTVAQGEQLQHCENLQERNRYIVTKSARMIRGMTWSGWVMNMFSKDIEPPPSSNRDHGGHRHRLVSREDNRNTTTAISSSCSNLLSHGDSIEIDNMPPEIQDQARILQNYELNVNLLAQCEKNGEEFDMCQEICNKLRVSARLAGHDDDGTNRSFHDNQTRHSRIVQRLRQKFKQVEEWHQKMVEENKVNFKKHSSESEIRKEHLISSNIRSNPKTQVPTWAKTNDASLQRRITQQEEHLDALAENISELLQNGSSIGISLAQQNQLLDKLDTNVDELQEQTKMVTRRADRLSHQTLWRKPPKDFQHRVAIQHVQSKRYLSIEPHKKNRIALHNVLHPDMSVFDIYKRRGSNLIGIENKCTGTWLGQSTWGSVVCTAKRFGSHEEWELDDDDDDDEPMDELKTRLLCASANWGNGGWLEVNAETETFVVGDYTTDAKQKAAMWSIMILNHHDDGR